MSTCPDCTREMSTAPGCSLATVEIDGAAIPRIRHRPARGPSGGRCGDCGAGPGGFHHLGCDLERCPRCGDQLISCGCWTDGHDDESGHEGAEDEEADDAFLLSRGLTPFPAAVAPLRARHHDTVRAIAEQALAEGRECDRDAVAVGIDAIEEHRTEAGIRLDRAEVDGLFAAVRNRASLLRTLLPATWVEGLWLALRWVTDTDGLAPGSDPVPALFEPLQCYGGLYAAGRPRPEGVDVDFPCQCALPHDPTCPPGLAQHVVGFDRDRRELLVVHAEVALRSADPPVSTMTPLFALVRRLRDEDDPAVVPVDRLRWVGWVPSDRWAPRLALYRPIAGDSGSVAPLAVDAGGTCWVPKPDRRRKRRFRWIVGHPSGALRRAGIDPFPCSPVRAEDDVWGWPDGPEQLTPLGPPASGTGPPRSLRLV